MRAVRRAAGEPYAGSETRVFQYNSVMGHALSWSITCMRLHPIKTIWPYHPSIHSFGLCNRVLADACEPAGVLLVSCGLFHNATNWPNALKWKPRQ